MNRGRPFALLLACLLLMLVGRAAAQDAPLARPRQVIVAMESSLGSGGAAKVRALLRRQTSATVLSVSEAEAQGVKQGVMLVVELDRAQKVTVLFVDESGQTDILSAPLAPLQPDVPSVVATLAAALLQRHPAPASAPEGKRVREADLELANVSRALYAAFGRLGVFQRRTGRLSAEDF